MTVEHIVEIMHDVLRTETTRPELTITQISWLFCRWILLILLLYGNLYFKTSYAVIYVRYIHVFIYNICTYVSPKTQRVYKLAAYYQLQDEYVAVQVFASLCFQNMAVVCAVPSQVMQTGYLEVAN